MGVLPDKTREQPSRLARYGFAVICVGIALLISLVLRPLAEPNPFLLFWIVVALSAWYGGLESGIFAALLSAVLTNWYFFPVPAQFDLDSVSLLRMIGFLLGAAIISALYEQQRRTERALYTNRDQTLLLQRITGRLSGAISYEQVAAVILDEAQNVLGCSSSSIYLMSDDQQSLEIVTQQGISKENQQQYGRIPLTLKGPLLDAVNQHHPVWIHDSTEYGRLYPHLMTAIRRNGTEASACFPLIAREITIGGISLSYASARRFDESERALLTAIMQQCGQALERARLYDAERRNEAQMRLITDSLPVLIAYVDQEERYQFNNHAYERWFGYSPDSIRGKKVREVIGDQAYQIVEAYMRKALTGETAHYEEQLAYRAGGIREVEGVYVPDFDDEGRVRGYFSMINDITRRKRAEQRLQALQRITAAFSGALTPQQVAGVVITQGLNLLNAHAASISLLSEDRTELVIVSAHELKDIWPRVSLDIRSTLTDAVRTGTPVWIATPEEYVQRYPEWAEISAAQGVKAGAILPFFVDSRVTGCLGIAFNTPQTFTDDDRALMEALAQQCALALERARLYDETREQREHLRVTLASIGDAVIATDETGLITFMNPIAQALTGWIESEAIGKPLPEVFRIINESSRQTVENPVEKVIREGTIVGLANHTLLISRSGREIPIDDSGAPIRGEENRMIGVILVFRDITERKASETLITETLSKTQDLYEITRRLSVATTADEVLNALGSSRGLRGLYHAAALIFDTVWEETPPASYRVIAGLRPDVAFSGHVGERRPLESHPFHALFNRSTPVMVSDIAGDERFSDMIESEIHSVISSPLVSGDKWYGQLSLFSRQPVEWTEKELGHIKGLVDLVATVLQNIQLFEMEKSARQLAEEANHLKLRFLGMISHELRTPLTSIKGFASSLLAHDVQWDEESRQQFITIIDSEADKLKNLIEQLLDLTSLEAGTLRIQARGQSLPDILNSAMPQLQMITARHQLTVRVPDDLPPVVADSQRIGQVLVNLVQNATKYAPFNSEIVITAKPVDGHLQISVQDRGPGIPPEARSYVFEAFRQVDDPKRFKSGAGLGLAICKGLVEGHGGHIWIDDYEFGGTIISFTLPFSRQ